MAETLYEFSHFNYKKKFPPPPRQHPKDYRCGNNDYDK